MLSHWYFFLQLRAHSPLCRHLVLHQVFKGNKISPLSVRHFFCNSFFLLQSFKPGKAQHESSFQCMVNPAVYLIKLAPLIFIHIHINIFKICCLQSTLFVKQFINLWQVQYKTYMSDWLNCLLLNWKSSQNCNRLTISTDWIWMQTGDWQLLLFKMDNVLVQIVRWWLQLHANYFKKSCFLSFHLSHSVE